MSITRSRTIQYILLLLTLGLLAGGYWYFNVRAGVTNQKSQTTMLTNGLVGIWTFDGADLSTTTATDRSGSGNNGTLTNSPTPIQGKVGQALDFDGTDDYVTVADSDSLTPSTITITAWFKVDSSGTVFPVYSQRFNSNNRIDIFVGGNSLYCTFSSGSDSNPGIFTYVTDTSWHHIACEWDGATVSTYLDGTLVMTEAYSGTLPNISAPAEIGRRGSPANYFDGALDEVRIYNRVLSGGEVKSLYDLGASDKTNTSAGQLQGTGRLDSGLAGYWKLDENTGTSAADSSVNVITAGTLTGGPTWTTGQIGSGVDFDGTDDYVTVTDNAALDFGDTDALTLTAWFNRDTFTTDDTLIAKRDGITAADTGYIVYIDDATDQLIFENSDGTDEYSLTSASTFTATGWNHFAIVWDQDSAANSEIYINGVANSATDSGTIGNIGSLANALAFRMGTESDAGNPFDGKLDEVRVYDRVLSPEEIANLYRLTMPTGVDTSLKGYWSFNGGDVSGTSAYDRSGARNNGTMTGSPVIDEGRIGQALMFDEVDDYISAGSATTVDDLETQGGGGLTASAWIYPESNGSFGGTIVGKATSPSPSSGDWALSIHQDSDSIKFDKSYSTTSLSVRSRAGTMELNKWQFVTATWDGTAAVSGVHLYINGIDVTSSSGQAGIGTKVSDASNNINISSQFLLYDGLIDEIRVHNRILSVEEIRALYEAGTPDKVNTSISTPQGTGRLDSGLAGYWKLDENTGTSAADSSTNATTAGTLTNGPTWTTGQIGSGVNFDGTDDYITIADADVLTPSSVSVAAWFKLDSTGTLFPIYSHRSSSNNRVDMLAGNNTIYCTFGNGSSSNFGFHTYTSDTSWHHLICAWDGVNIFTYLDGALVETEAFSGSLSNFSASLYIGSRSLTEFMDGTIDDVRLYNRALSVSEASQLYRLSSPTGIDTSLEGYWSFNGPDVSGTTVYDRSGAGRNGTLTNGATIVEGKVGQGVSFDGVDDVVNIGAITTVRDDFTLALWFRTTDNTGANTLLSDYNGNAGDTTVIDYSFGAIPFTNLSTYGGSLVAINVPEENQWHHIVFTRTASSGALVAYVDGVSVDTDTGSTGTINPGSNGNWGIGGRYSSGIDSISGVVDEVRFYSRVLSADEVKTLHSSGK